MKIELAQVVTQIFAFLIMMAVMKRYAWKPILDILEERKKKIQAEFEEIEKTKKEAERLAQKYRIRLEYIDEAGRLKIQDAVHKGRMIAQEIQDTAHTNALKILEKAKEDSQRELNKAKIQLKHDIVNISSEMALKIIGQGLDEEQHRKLVADFVEEAEFQ